MCGCGVKTRSVFGGLATLMLIAIIGIGAANPNGNTKQNSILVAVTPTPGPPSRPISSDCSNFFPGTPGWNECFMKFSQDMASYQTKMNEYNWAQDQTDKGSADDYLNMNYPGQYSHSVFSSSSNAKSTSNSYTGGYAIHAENMALSTSQNNNAVRVVLYTGPIDTFDTKINGNEITINVLSKGQQKRARILVPKGIKVTDVKVEHSSDSVYVTGPTSVNDGGNFQYSQSGSSNSANFNHNFGQFQSHSGPMPPMAMPHMQNMFQNMFQNIFANIFGGRSYAAASGRNYGYAFPPQMWFY